MAVSLDKAQHLPITSFSYPGFKAKHPGPVAACQHLAPFWMPRTQARGCSTQSRMGTQGTMVSNAKNRTKAFKVKEQEV